MEGGTANDYAYVDDLANEFDLTGTRSWTSGVARREKYGQYNKSRHRWETKTKEMCRSFSRGAGRVARSLSPRNINRQAMNPGIRGGGRALVRHEFFPDPEPPENLEP